MRLKVVVRCREWICSICLILFALVPQSASCQGRIGLTTSDYSGSGRAMLNPAALVLSKHYLEAGLFQTDLFLGNNAAYLREPAFSLPDSIFQRQGTSGRYMHQNSRVAVPSVLVAIGNHAFSFGQSVRTASSASRVPNDISHILFNGHPTIPNKTYYHDRRFDMASLGWVQWSAAYATLIRSTGGRQFAAGISVNMISGLYGAYYHNRSVTYQDRNGRSYDIHSIDAQIGLSLPLDYQTSDPILTGVPFYGRGASIDAGVVLSRPLQEVRYRRIQGRRSRYRQHTAWCAHEYIPYQSRIGFSLLDFGSIQYNRRMVVLELEDAASTPGVDFNSQGVENIESFIDEVAAYFNEQRDSIASLRTFTVGLPTAVSLQADYRIGSHMSLHGVMMQAVPWQRNRVTAPSYLSFAPRFAWRWIEASLPMTLYEYRQPGLGMSVRLGYLTLGTDNLLRLAGSNHMTGMDFYIALQIGLLKGNCRIRQPGCVLY